MSDWAEFLDLFPDLQELILTNTQISTFGRLEPINGQSHPHLSTLDLRGSQLQVNERNMERYKSHFRDRFPNLKVLDGEMLPVVQFAVEKNEELPVKGSFLSPEASEIVFPFITAFFSAMDNNRDQLTHVYHSGASFSLMCIGRPPVGLNDKSRNMKDIKDTSMYYFCVLTITY
jgi:hypothetical protein